jgi:hypothetical protein
MKKSILGAFALSLLIGLGSCKSSSSSLESDVRKMAEYRCKMQQLMAKDVSDEKVTKELEDLKKEMEAFGEEMSKKYEDKKDDKEMEAKAEAIMKEEMDKCK